MQKERESIYDDVRQLVAVSPEKSQYDAKERVLFVFNKPLFIDGGPFEVEFKGDSHSLRVPAELLNSCTIQVHAPVYYPPERTTVTIYDKIKQHNPFIAECSFEFVSRSRVLGDLLEKTTDPEHLLCDSLGISTTDIKQFDGAMAQKIKQKTPHDFNLLDVTQTFSGKFKDQVESTYPTVMHFAAAHGLIQTSRACLRYCPAASKACALKNIYGLLPKEMAKENGHNELSEDLSNFESSQKPNNPDRIQLQHAPDSIYNDIDNEDVYEKMNPTELTFEEEVGDEYVTIEEKGHIYNHEIHITPEMWKAIFIAEQAVNESWRNDSVSEKTAKAFSQFIQKCARQHSENSSPTFGVTSCQESAPVLPPKTYPMDKKRHSIHAIDTARPPLPPRSPLSPRSLKLFSGLGGLSPSDRRGSDPNIFHRMQHHFDRVNVSEESPDQPPEIPARPRSPLPPKVVKSVLNERRGSAPNVLFRRPHGEEKNCSFHEMKQFLTLPQKPSQAANGVKRPSILPNNLNCQGPNSLDVTSMGLSPRLPPRQPQPTPRRQRAVSCDPAIPSCFDSKTRALSEPDEYGFVTVVKK